MLKKSAIFLMIRMMMRMKRMKKSEKSLMHQLMLKMSPESKLLMK
jgi:hypothetical protein